MAAGADLPREYEAVPQGGGCPQVVAPRLQHAAQGDQHPGYAPAIVRLAEKRQRLLVQVHRAVVLAPLISPPAQIGERPGDAPELSPLAREGQALLEQDRRPLVLALR